MTIDRVCLALLRLYPDRWRERYESEVQAVIAQSETSPATAIDLLVGAFDAHLHPVFPVPTVRRLRSSVVMGLFCWIAFAVVGAGFAKATEDPPFRAAEAAHGLLGGAHIAVEVLALAGGVVLVVAGAPIALRVVGQAYRGDRALRRVLLILCIAVGGFALLSAVAAVLAQYAHGKAGPLGGAVFVAYVALGMAAAAVCGWCARRAVFVARLEWIELITGTVGAWLLARLMTALTAAVVLYTIVLAAEAPDAAALSNGPLRFGTTLVLAGLAAAMALISALALLTSRASPARI
jgi:hypothetical protein